MTAAAPEGMAALQSLAQTRPDLADRVNWVAARLAHVRPRPGETGRGSVEDAARRLRALPVLDEADMSGTSDDPQSLSWLAHRALDRAIHAAFPAIVDATEQVLQLALALGAGFEPIPVKLVDLYDHAQGLQDPKVPGQIAWLAGHRGAEPLVAGLAGVISSDPERALDFLDAAIAAYDRYPPSGSLPGLEAEPPARAEPASPPPGRAEGASPLPPASPPPPPPTDGHPLPPAYGQAPPAYGPPTGEPGSRGSRKKRRLRDLLRKALPPFGSEKSSRDQASPPTGDEPAEAQHPPAVVSTGFCEQRGGPPLAADRTLGAGRRYEFFVEIAPRLVPGAIDQEGTPLPDLPAGTVVQVALFGFDDQLRPVGNLDVGELSLIAGGSAIVQRQPGGQPGGGRLYLAVDTPPTTGTHGMRCNIYRNQALLQSRVVEVRVTAEPGAAYRGALRSTLDFSVSSDLSADDVEALQPRTLSVLLNDNGNGTHGFKFFGGSEFKREVTITGETLTQHLAQARKWLRQASWNRQDEPTREEFADLAYRYAEPSWDLLAADLPMLARSGCKLWDALVYQLSGGDDEALRSRMRAPGRVEFANKQSLDLLVPAACLYDYPLDIDEPEPSICAVFREAFGTQPLEATPCFNGACPTYDDPRVVCPSGFWGFRHQIGYSASLSGGESDDAHNFALTVGGRPAVFVAGASADEGLIKREEHLRRIAALAGEGWNLAMTRTALYDLFRGLAPSVVYLYGHGGDDGGAPYFEVGSGDDGPIIRASLRGKANWATTRPLVFLNGCHTAALSPSAAFNYATGFLQTAHASAVIGTEIAVFESLAGRFAEECLRRFVVECRPLGEAMLGSRIALLEEGIPLGLAYLAFGPIDVRLAG